MACDYQAIRADNKRRYGTDIGRIGPMLLADRYDDRTHFIFELLQNAEDALARRAQWPGSRSVSFHLTPNALRVSHWGRPFDEADVRGICGIAESTKDLTAIGRFGIGFKSVYAFTDRPEVHSGTEDFAIESFVWPVAAPSLVRDPEETLISIPLKASDQTGPAEIGAGLGQLGASALLFLRQIEEIRWSVEGGRSGLYLRESKEVDTGVRRVTVIGEERGKDQVYDEWLVFSRPVATDGGQQAGYVEIAFSLVQDEEAERESIKRLDHSPLVVFFPTVVESHLGFLVQGPYRSTPSRDNVPRHDPWNQGLVGKTGALLVEALRWLREHGLLDSAALGCLPLDASKFGETTMFAPLFAATKEALLTEALLPAYQSGHVSAPCALLARTQDLRDLLSKSQLGELFDDNDGLVWLSGDITQDRSPELRQYLMQELDIAEVTPDAVLARLTQPFLEAQSDDWVLRLYEFLDGQPALRPRAEGLPLIRLTKGAHVTASEDGRPRAFLPGATDTDFPTVRATVCASLAARAFLQALGLTEPDPVDDVIWNVLPKYRADEVDVGEDDYGADIRRIMRAFATDSKGQRDKLLEALRETTFVMALDAGDGSECFSTPGGVYLATERLRDLFTGVSPVLLVDDDCPCLRGEDVRQLLEACGAARYLQPILPETELTWEQRAEIRRGAGLERHTWGRLADATLRGLGTLLNVLPRLDAEARRGRAILLWDALTDVESRRGSGVFSGEYTWGYSHITKTAPFDASFVRQLNATAWVPDGNGDLQRPDFVLFDTLGWKSNPFLQSRILFKRPIIDQLAKEAGIEPGVLDLLKKLGFTTVADLAARLGVSNGPQHGDSEPGPATVADAIKSLLGDAPGPTPPVPVTDPTGSESTGSGSDRGGTGPGAGEGAGSGKSAGDRRDGQGGGPRDGPAAGSERRVPGGGGGRPFISYVAVHPDDDDPDPDGLDQPARMALEAQAIDLILASEPKWRRTPTHNPGYDLFELGERATPERWCEVKAMTGSLRDRPVGLSHTQFDCAREHASAYWLYVVERAGEADARIVRIQDPAGKARTFTFDRGWLDVADVDTDPDDREE